MPLPLILVFVLGLATPALAQDEWTDFADIIWEEKSANFLDYEGGVPEPILEELELITDPMFQAPFDCISLPNQDQILFDTLTITNMVGPATMVMFTSDVGDADACFTSAVPVQFRLYRGGFDPDNPLQNCDLSSERGTAGAQPSCSGMFFTMAPGEEVTLVFNTGVNFLEASYQINWREDTFAFLFTDGFESGDTSAWSATVP